MQYVGSRYVPKFMGAYDVTQVYEALCVVDNGMGTSYISKKPTPAGTALTDTTYWTVYGASSGAIINLQNQIDVLNSKVHPKKYLLIGDSYAGYTNGGIHYSWADDVISLTGIDAVKLTAGGIGFRSPHDSVGSFLTLLQQAVNNDTLGSLEDYTDIIVAGGANDITGIVYDDVSISELETNMTAFLSYCTSNFPNAKLSISFIGMVYSPNFTKAYYQALNVYRNCIKIGISYIKNTEYILQPGHMLADGIHPNATGFSELAKYLSDAILTGSCNVDRDLTAITIVPTLDASVGSWNLLPQLKASQHNGLFTIYNGRPNINLELNSNNRVTIDNVTASKSTNAFKLFSIGMIGSHNLKGANWDIDTTVQICENIPVALYTTTSKFINLTTPLMLIQGVLYIAIPKEAAALLRWTSSNQYVTDNILRVYLNEFSIQIDTSNYDAQNITSF